MQSAQLIRHDGAAPKRVKAAGKHGVSTAFVHIQDYPGDIGTGVPNAFHELLRQRHVHGTKSRRTGRYAALDIAVQSVDDLLGLTGSLDVKSAQILSPVYHKFL